MAQNLVVVPGQGEHTAEVVVHHPDLHPLGGFLLQDGQDAIPKDPRLQDEVFQKNIPLCLFQLLQHPGEGVVPQGEVLGLGVGVGWTGGPALQIAGLSGGVPAQREQVVRLEVLPQGLGGLLQQALHPPLGALGDGSASHQQVEDAAEDGEGQHQHQPSDFIARLHLAADDGQGGQEAEQDTAPVKGLGVGGKDLNHHRQGGNLRHQSHTDED